MKLASKSLIACLVALAVFAALMGPASDVAADSSQVDVDAAGPTDLVVPDSPNCPNYRDSELYRGRGNRITIGPGGDWEQAVLNAPAGTEILLRDGEYQMTRYALNITQPNITIRGASGNRDAVLIRGRGYGVGGEGLMVSARRFTVADLSMTAIRNHAISIKPEGGAAAVHVYNVHLFDNGTQQIKASGAGANRRGVVACSAIGYTPGGVQGDYIGAIDLHRAVNWSIRDNYIYNVTGDGSGCEIDIDCGRYNSHPAILVWNNSRNIVIERNTIIDSWRGITLGLGTTFVGATVRNNFIYRTEAGDAGIELYGARDVTVEHNTVFAPGYRGAIEFGSSPNLILRNNLVTTPPLNRPERGGSANVTRTGNIANARVSDLANPGQPQLANGSRAIGAGSPSPVTVDIDGDSRTGRWDVGADQYS